MFADTQEEPQAVYAHLWWLVQQLPFPVYVDSVGRLGDHVSRGVNATGQTFISIPAFNLKGWHRSRKMRQCTKQFKTDLIARIIRRQVVGLSPHRPLPRKVTVHQLIGISADEARRAVGTKVNIESRRGWFAEFPLLDCVSYLSERVPHTVPKSSCVFCPFRSDAMWRGMQLQGGPDWQRACEIDEALREIDFTRQQEFQWGFTMECSGTCGV